MARNFLNDVSKHGLNESMKQDKWIERIRRPSAISLFVPVRHIAGVDIAGNTITTLASSKTRTAKGVGALFQREDSSKGNHARLPRTSDRAWHVKRIRFSSLHRARARATGLASSFSLFSHRASWLTRSFDDYEIWFEYASNRVNGFRQLKDDTIGDYCGLSVRCFCGSRVSC